jgi:hypothetical protein
VKGYADTPTAQREEEPREPCACGKSDYEPDDEEHRVYDQVDQKVLPEADDLIGALLGAVAHLMLVQLLMQGVSFGAPSALKRIISANTRLYAV